MMDDPNPNPSAPKSSRFKTVVAWVCGPIVLVELIALVAVMIWAMRVASDAKSSGPTWVSMSRLLAGGAEMNPKMANGEPIPDTFIATNVELIQSSSVLRGAEMRVHELHPDLKRQPCRLTAGRVPGASIIVLQARGSEPAYVQAFLDAVMDEFIAKRKEMRMGSGEGAMIAIQDELVRLEKEMPHAEQRVKAAEQSGASPETLIESKARLHNMKMHYERLIDTLRKLDVRHSDGDSFAIIERASRPALMVPQFSIFNLFK